MASKAFRTRWLAALLVGALTIVTAGLFYWIQTSPKPGPLTGNYEAYPNAYPVELSSSLTGTAVAVETLAALKDADATLAAIEFAASPQPSPSPISTGVYEDERTAMQWRQLGLDVENAWIGYIGRMQMTAWAGKAVSDSRQGGVQVIVEFPRHPISQWFPSPEPIGSLHIVGEKNNRLILESKQGDVLYFDMPSLEYAESLDQVLATVTPPPTLWP